MQTIFVAYDSTERFNGLLRLFSREGSFGPNPSHGERLHGASLFSREGPAVFIPPSSTPELKGPRLFAEEGGEEVR